MDHPPTMPSPREALWRLVEGNERFQQSGDWTGRPWRQEIATEPQRPFAVVIGCSDSRAPVEILFDQGFGDLFVARLAGNVIAPSVVGSVEFAASEFGTRLVVVLGHTRCGAIAATVRAIQTGHGPESHNIRSITDRIEPHIQPVVTRGATGDPAALHREAMRANVSASADQLRHGSRILEDLVLGGELAVVGAEWELETGRVNFFDGTAPLQSPPG